MAHMVFCVRYKKEMEGLDEPPFDSEFGQKIYKNVSKAAWDEWVNRQKMLLERVSPPALAAAGAAVSRRADGRVFLRLRLGHAVAVRSAGGVTQLDGEKWPAPEGEFRIFLYNSGGSEVDCQMVDADYGGSPIPGVFPASSKVAFS